MDPHKPRWSAYRWALEKAQELETGVSIVAGTYGNFRKLDDAIGSSEAQRLALGDHAYTVQGVHVRAVPARSTFFVSGVVLVAWATDARMAQVEGQHPAAVAAVASLPDDIAGWRSVHPAERIGEVRPEQESEFDSAPAEPLDPRAAAALSSSGAMINQNHAAMDTDEREGVAGALLAIRAAGLSLDPAAIRAHLMSEHWSGPIIEQALELASRIESGKRPRHRPYGPL